MKRRIAFQLDYRKVDHEVLISATAGGNRLAWKIGQSRAWPRFRRAGQCGHGLRQKMWTLGPISRLINSPSKMRSADVVGPEVRSRSDVDAFQKEKLRVLALEAPNFEASKVFADLCGRRRATQYKVFRDPHSCDDFFERFARTCPRVRRRPRVRQGRDRVKTERRPDA